MGGQGAGSLPERRDRLRDRLRPFLSPDASCALDLAVAEIDAVPGRLCETAVELGWAGARSARFYLVAWPEKSEGRWRTVPGSWTEECVSLPEGWPDSSEWWLGKV